jgi:hypothetical protein
VCHIILKNDWKENVESIGGFVFESLWLDFKFFLKWNKSHIMHFQTTFCVFYDWFDIILILGLQTMVLDYYLDYN